VVGKAGSAPAPRQPPTPPRARGPTPRRPNRAFDRTAPLTKPRPRPGRVRQRGGRRRGPAARACPPRVFADGRRLQEQDRVDAQGAQVPSRV
jgi:hypothetical protein